MLFFFVEITLQIFFGAVKKYCMERADKNKSISGLYSGFSTGGGFDKLAMQQGSAIEGQNLDISRFLSCFRIHIFVVIVIYVSFHVFLDFYWLLSLLYLCWKFSGFVRGVLMCFVVLLNSTV